MKHYAVEPEKLADIFDNTTATYKFYWMLALLDVVRNGRAHYCISFTEMVARMISKAWAPLTSGLFTFGPADKLSSRIVSLIHNSELKDCDTEERVRAYILTHAEENVVKDIVDRMTKYVPYRFLYPWLGNDNKPNRRTAQLSCEGVNNCIYSIHDKSIRINPAWIEYLTDHLDVYESFTKYNLCYYLARYNNLLMPDEEILTTTADGFSTSVGHQYSFAAEPFPQNGGNEVEELRRKLKRTEQRLHRMQDFLIKIVPGINFNAPVNVETFIQNQGTVNNR